MSLTTPPAPPISPRTVLVAVDSTKRPLDPVRLAGELARILQAPLELVTAFPYLPVLQDPNDEDLIELRAAARDDLLELGRELDAVEIADAHVVASNTPACVLQELSERSDAGLLVIGSTTHGAMRRLLLGTVGERLVEGSGCPLAIAPHGYGDSSTRPVRVVGAAFDGSDESRRALEGARALADRAGARLRILTVHQRMTFGGISASAGAPSVSANHALQKALHRRLDEAVAACDGELDVAGDFRTGNVAEVLAEASEELDLLVAGSRSFGPVGAVLVGHTTRDLLRSAACPLIITPRATRLDIAERSSAAPKL